MNQFVQRVANYIANEVLIKGLANSKTFQRFALRTDRNIQEMRKQGTESFESMTKRAASSVAAEGGSAATKASTSGPPIPPPRGMYGFFRAFAYEVRRDLGGAGSGATTK